MQFVDFAPVKLVFGPGRLEALRTEPLPGTRALILPTTGRAMERNGAVYMVAIGGAGAAKAASIKKVEVIAYDELGCESVKRLTVENFSAIVSQDSVGGNLYTEGVAKYKKDYAGSLRKKRFPAHSSRDSAH